MATAPTLPPPPSKLKPVAVPALDAKLGKGPGKIGVLAFGVVLIIGVIYAGSSLGRICRVSTTLRFCRISCLASPCW